MNGKGDRPRPRSDAGQKGWDEYWDQIEKQKETPDDDKVAGLGEDVQPHEQ